MSLDGAGATLASGAPFNAGFGGPDSGHVRVSALSEEPEDLCVWTPYPTKAPSPRPAPVDEPQTARPTGKSTACTDVPSPDMVKAKLTCAESLEELACNKDKTWTYHKYCQHSCFFAGKGYAAVTCAAKEDAKDSPSPKPK